MEKRKSVTRKDQSMVFPLSAELSWLNYKGKPKWSIILHCVAFTTRMNEKKLDVELGDHRPF